LRDSDGTAASKAGAGGVLQMHGKKTGAVWSAFDLTVEKPSCKLMKEGTATICGNVPSACAGTTNYWAHLWTWHRPKWYELKRSEGQLNGARLNAAGEDQLKGLKLALANAASSSSAHSLSHNKGGEFLSSKLPPAAKETLDPVTSEWAVDEDQGFNAASTPGFCMMMCTATNGLYDGCCDKTVKQHSTAMAMEGQQECTTFHHSLLAGGVKPAASGDL